AGNAAPGIGGAGPVLRRLRLARRGLGARAASLGPRRGGGGRAGRGRAGGGRGRPGTRRGHRGDPGARRAAARAEAASYAGRAAALVLAVAMSAANVAAAILAGGGGTRMGEGVVKGLLSVGGERIIDRQLAVLRPLFAEVVIAANDPEPWVDLGLRVVPDR